jgi:hypothetical protein
MRRKYFRTWLQKYSCFQAYTTDEKEYDIQVHILFTLILLMLVVSSRPVVYWKGICALLGFYALSSCSFLLMIRTTNWSHLQRLNVWPLKMGSIGCPKTLVWNYRETLHESQNSRDLVYIMAEAWNHRLLERVGRLQSAHGWLFMTTVVILFAGYCVYSFTTHIPLVLLCSEECLLVEHIQQYIV